VTERPAGRRRVRSAWPLRCASFRLPPWNLRRSPS